MTGALSAEPLDVSLIICSRGRPQLLLETVESVLAGEQVPAELVIVDQSEGQHPVLAAWQPRRGEALRYLHSRSTGLSRARNEAIAAARCDVLVIIDDDMLVRPDWLGTFVSALAAAGTRSVVTGRVLPDAGAGSGGFVPAVVTAEEPAVYTGRLDRDVLAGGHMACRREVFEQVGGFDARLGAGSHFPAADDNDLGFRLLEAGYRIVFVPEAVVYHRAWRPAREYLVMRWRYGLGKGGFYGKYLGLRDRHMAGRLLRDIGRRVLAFPSRLRRETRRAAGDVLYSFGVLVGVLRWQLMKKTG